MHARFDGGPWGLGRWGLRPTLYKNMGGGRSFGWWRLYVWTTR